MAAPNFQAAGTVTAGVGAISVPWPAHQADDIGVLILEQDAADTSFSPPAGWTAFTGLPVTVTGSVTNSKFSAWWKRAASGSEADVSISDLGNHQIARIVTIRGCATSGDPFDVVSSVQTDTTEDTSQSILGATTTGADRLVLILCSNAGNFATNAWSSLTNSDLTSLTDQASFHDTAGSGGGSLVATGVKASAGTYGTTTVTSQRTSVEASISIAFKGAGGGTLTAESGSISFTGTVADPKITMPAANGFPAQVLAPDPMNCRITMPADSQAYVFTGTDANTFKTSPNITMAADSGAFTFSGTVADPLLKMPADSVAYIFTGTAAGTFKSVLLAAESGAFAFAGTLVDLRLTMPADPGALSFAGSAINALLKMPAGSAAYVFTGSAVDLRLKMPAGLGAFTFTGSPATTSVSVSTNTVLRAEAGRAYVIGKDVTLRASSRKSWLGPGDAKHWRGFTDRTGKIH